MAKTSAETCNLLRAVIENRKEHQAADKKLARLDAERDRIFSDRNSTPNARHDSSAACRRQIDLVAGLMRAQKQLKADVNEVWK